MAIKRSGYHYTKKQELNLPEKKKKEKRKNDSKVLMIEKLDINYS
ncbi:hypothetical protein AAAC51_16065 [Priestia megaterium]